MQHLKMWDKQATFYEGQMRLLMSSTIVLAALTGCPKKVSNVVIEGWYAEEGWAGQCYYHKNFATLGRGDVYEARQASMDAMMSQWRGERNDGIQFDEEKIIELETTILGNISLLDTVASQNLKQCIDHFREQRVHKIKQNWFWGINGILTEGDCKSPPLTYTLFDYLDVGKGWQIQRPSAKVIKSPSAGLRLTTTVYRTTVLG